MKRIMFIIAIISAVVFASCNNGEADASKTAPKADSTAK